MKKAIGICAKRAPRHYDLGASKFFGTPTVPSAWETDFDDDEIFFCQIRLADVAALDEEQLLPHSGYLYVFLHTEGGEYHLRADVRYFDGEPDMALDGFNDAVEGYERFSQAYLMEFGEAEADADGTRLLGVPTDWGYEAAPPRLLMQLDPLDSDMGFLDSLDGYLYLFFGKDIADLSAVTLAVEHS